MAISTVAVPVPRSIRRVLIRVLVITAALALLVILGFSLLAHLALPKLDGTLKVEGLSAPVTVIRDARGVPNISAATLEDLFFAQGYITAQDRLWQMDMSRRYAAGEMAEILGQKYVAHDRQQRTLLVRQSASNAASQLSARDRAFFEAYARGVNAYIASAILPMEFQILRYRPRPWTATDSFLVATNMVQTLNLENLAHQLTREKLSARLAPELAADLYPTTSWRDRPPYRPPAEETFLAPEEGEQEQPSEPQDSEPIESPKKPRTLKLRARIRNHSQSRTPKRQSVRTANRSRHVRASLQAPPVTAGTSFLLGSNGKQSPDSSALIPGSNNWVISGAHTASGKPLLANDMHLKHQIPNVWYEAHLTSGNYDVAGVTLPGLPYVIVGHNQRIAWGFTNIGPAVADLFIETFNDRGEYQTPEGWRPATHYQETIHVRGGRDEVVDVTVTRHGPIVSALHPGESRPLALKWTLHNPTAVQVPFFDMNAAQNWDEFRRALSRFGSPAQNVVYADVDGHIGYQAAGMIPVRASGDGSLPVPGNDNSHEWTSYIPFEKLPTVFDPPSGIIATANGRITYDGYPYLISNEWGPPFRTERIYHVLESDKKFTPTDMLELQTDVYSDFDRFCAQRFVYAIDHVANSSPRVRQAAELMRNWDGRETADSAAAAIVAESRQELARMLLIEKLGEQWQEYRWFSSSVWLENLLLLQPPQWLPSRYPTWDNLLAAAVDAAVTGKDAPRKLEGWRFGRKLTMDLRHPVFGTFPLLRRFTNPGKLEQSGNAYTVKQVGPNFGPSERLIVDLANLDNSTLNIVTGQSGNIFGRHYMDQWKAWHEGRTFPLPFSPSTVNRAKRNQLVLQP